MKSSTEPANVLIQVKMGDALCDGTIWVHKVYGQWTLCYHEATNFDDIKSAKRVANYLRRKYDWDCQIVGTFYNLEGVKDYRVLWPLGVLDRLAEVV